MTIPMTNSEMFTFQRCPRMWLLKYYFGYVPDADEVTGNRILGTRIHIALQGMYGYGLDALAVLHLVYQFALEQFPDYEADLVKERDLASAMVEGYIEWLAAEGADAGMRVVATEAKVTVPLPGVPGVELWAKLDQVVLDEATGLLSFLDHKTTASFERHEILLLNPQFRFYSLVQKLAVYRHIHDDDGTVEGCPGCFPDFAPRVLGGIVNTLRRVKRSDKSKPPYYQRDPFRYNESDIDSTLRKVQGRARQILAARATLDHIYAERGGDLALLNDFQREHLPPTAIETDCSWRCPFVQLCPMLDDGSDWVGSLVRSGHFRQENPYAYYDDDPLARVRQELAAQ
jgi:PD-(D/E)XK nuclease superfamily